MTKRRDESDDPTEQLDWLRSRRDDTVEFPAASRMEEPTEEPAGGPDRKRRIRGPLLAGAALLALAGTGVGLAVANAGGSTGSRDASQSTTRPSAPPSGAGSSTPSGAGSSAASSTESGAGSDTGSGTEPSRAARPAPGADKAGAGKAGADKGKGPKAGGPPSPPAGAPSPPAGGPPAGGPAGKPPKAGSAPSLP